jgi:hypothetical protein
MRLESDNAGRIYLVDTLRAGVPITDQPGILEYAQVLGDGWSADGKASRQLDHSQRPFSQALQYHQARGISESLESGV